MKMKVPFGVFTLREKSEGDVIFVGGGSGMAPILSILRHMAEKGIERKATFYYGARTKKDLFYEDEIRSWASRCPASSGTCRPSPSPRTTMSGTGRRA